MLATETLNSGLRVAQGIVERLRSQRVDGTVDALLMEKHESRQIVCPVHDMPIHDMRMRMRMRMRIIRLQESEEDPDDVEWIFWQCLEGECTQVVIDMNP